MTSETNKKQCPYCAETIEMKAIRCRFCGSWLDHSRFMLGWTRSREYGKILGICAGLSQQFGIPVTFFRLAFIILTFFGGWGVLLYLALWLLMPWEKRAQRNNTSVVSSE